MITSYASWAYVSLIGVRGFVFNPAKCPHHSGALPPAETRHFPAITDPKEVGPLLRAIDGYEGSSVVKWALQLAPLLFVRPGELRNAQWSEIDFEAAEWTIPAERMKVRQSHIVPETNAY